MFPLSHTSQGHTAELTSVLVMKDFIGKYCHKRQVTGLYDPDSRASCRISWNRCCFAFVVVIFIICLFVFERILLSMCHAVPKRCGVWNNAKYVEEHEYSCFEHMNNKSTLVRRYFLTLLTWPMGIMSSLCSLPVSYLGHLGRLFFKKRTLANS